MNAFKYCVATLFFLTTILLLGFFIYLFCNNIIIVSSTIIIAGLCSSFAELTSFYLSKIGLVSMKVGDFVLLAKDTPEGSTRLVGEVIRFANGYYHISTSKFTVKLNPKNLQISSEDGCKYRFCGITQG